MGAITQSQAVGTFHEMEEAVAEAVTAYNSDINQEGVAPLQVVTGRAPPSQGDVLNNFSSRLAEHSLISVQPTLAGGNEKSCSFGYDQAALQSRPETSRVFLE